MGVAKSIEKRLEGLMEGFFTKLFRSGLQPVEIGRRMLREMDENRTVSIDRVYTPNDFRIFMGNEDYARMAQMEPGLQREFSELVIQKAKEERWNLMGLPQIAFFPQGDMGQGELVVEASFAAEPGRQPPQVSTREPNADDVNATRAISSVTAERLGLKSSGAELAVLGEDDTPRERISITRTPISIGRLSTNDVVLADANVSRRHAELRGDGGVWTLVDLGSTNGTLVNGKLAEEHQLRDGDRISFGTSELLFKSSTGA
jgi:Protein of unknown function (DUF3662)/FHA domain